MDLYDFYKTIIEGVAQDAKLLTWASSNFGNNLGIYAGAPAELPDMDDDTPVLVFGEPSRVCSQRDREITYAFEAWLGLSVSGAKGFNPSGENELKGVELAMDGARLVRLSIIDNMPDNIHLEDFGEDFDVNAVDTEVHGYMRFVFLETLTIGSDPMQ